MAIKTADIKKPVRPPVINWLTKRMLANAAPSIALCSCSSLQFVASPISKPMQGNKRIRLIDHCVGLEPNPMLYSGRQSWSQGLVQFGTLASALTSANAAKGKIITRARVRMTEMFSP